MTEVQVRTALRSFVEDNFLYMQPDLVLDDDDDLLEKGVVDSLGFVELVEEVEKRYGIGVRDEDISEENFGSIAAIARFVAARRAG